MSRAQAKRHEEELQRSLSARRSKSRLCRRPDSVGEILNPYNEEGSFVTSNSGIGSNLVFSGGYGPMQAPGAQRGQTSKESLAAPKPKPARRPL